MQITIESPGGPASQNTCDLTNGELADAPMEYCNWGMTWTKYSLEEQDDLLRKSCHARALALDVIIVVIFLIERN